MQVRGGEVVVELVECAGAEDHRRDGRAVGDPRERHLRHRHAALLGHLADRLDDPPRPLLGVARAVRLHAARRGPRRAGSRPSGSRRGVYLPVSQPPASGDHGSIPMPSFTQTSTSSNSMSRTSRLYCGCSVTIGARVAGEQRRLLQLPADEVADARRNGSCPRARRRRGRRASPRSGSAGPTRAPGRGRRCRRRAGAGSRPARGRGATGTSPASLRPSPIGKRPFVAMTT